MIILTNIFLGQSSKNDNFINIKTETFQQLSTKNTAKNSVRFVVEGDISLSFPAEIRGNKRNNITNNFENIY